MARSSTGNAASPFSQLGINEVWVEVREDLTEAEPGTIEQAFVQYNFNRRSRSGYYVDCTAHRLGEACQTMSGSWGYHRDEFS